ncbi:acetyl-CoA carboxylase biotin carboxyl carrier protein subunit [Ekhidna sp.]|uniref:acetyl-CoA carboxylase biotin carboxyl carrier protein subunit n=1 Tax=Ekhidna sp. TaxID=2608089 RepID=UPI003BAA8900
MLQIQVGNSAKINLEKKKDEIYLNDQLFDGEIVRISNSSFKVFKANKIYRVDVVESEGKEMKLKINDQLVEVSVTDHIDQILDKLGMNMAASTIVKDIKAPMPGSILNILVSEGDEVQQGDKLLVLEAMKMENVIKAPGEGKVSKVHIREKGNVEKNQVLITFE